MEFHEVVARKRIKKTGAEVGIHNRKQEHTHSTNKAIKKKERKHALDQKSDQEK